jgi:group I intron endonuclease
MFTVYKITNLINHKCYIGSSIRVEKRWKDHIRCSKNPNSSNYNYPLYQDFRKDGIENFSFEILSDNFDSIFDMEEYEQKMIDYYNCLKPNGYNQTRQTHSNNILAENCQKHIQKVSQKCAKIDIDENILEIYPSYHEAARANGYDGDNCATQIRLVCKGERAAFNNLYFRDLDEQNQIISKTIKRPHGKKALICISLDCPEEERYFDSISEAANILKLADRRQIQEHLKGSTRYSTVKGYILREIDIYGNIIENSVSIEEKIKEYNEKNPLINGERHTITEWCKIYGISRDSYYKRRKKGMDAVEAITAPKRR